MFRILLVAVQQFLGRDTETEKTNHPNKRSFSENKDGGAPALTTPETPTETGVIKKIRKDSDTISEERSTTSESSDSETGDSPFTPSPSTPNIRAVEAPTIPELSTRAQKPQLQKSQLINLLEEAFHSQSSNKVLTDINFTQPGSASFIALGRPKTEHGKKQLRHVIPFSFVKNLISGMIEHSLSANEALKKLIPVGLVFAKMQTGFALSSKQLEAAEYSAIRERADGKHFRSTTDGKTTTFFLSPSKESVFPTPGKKALAAKAFSVAHTSYVKKVLEDILQEIEHDPNTNIITSEILTRLILGIFNSAKNTCFAPEGNSSIKEIRVYDNPEECSKAGKDYEVFTARELQTRLETEPEDLNNCIRIVNCEGARVREIAKAIKLLDQIYSDSINLAARKKLISEYRQYNYPLKLANCETPEEYNAEISYKENYHQAAITHLAKLLYSSFDLKALEETRFACVYLEAEDAITVYTAATGPVTSQYNFMTGVIARNIEKSMTTDYTTTDVFRSREKDLEILPQKLAELFVIGTMALSNIPAEDCLILLTHLAALDHDLTETEGDLIEKTFGIYHELTNAGDSMKTGCLGDKFALATHTESQPSMDMAIVGDLGPADAEHSDMY